MHPAIRVQNLGKRYRLGLTHARSLNELAARWTAKLRGKSGDLLTIGEQASDRTTGGDYWALQDINFEVMPGEVVGIIGRNGAGKSTLLKILSRVTRPTTGQVDIWGRVGSLLEVGTGFHPELTGRENVYMNGTILGMTKREVDRRFDEIVDFAGVEKFIDTPVKRYSSGMKVRLGFAVAAHLEPEILIVDEVLAVGDAEFQRKCLGKMSDVASHGRTILFVSHNMAAVTNLCPKSIILDSGRLYEMGDTHELIPHYLKNTVVSPSPYLADIKERKGIGNIRFTGIELRNSSNHLITTAKSGDNLTCILGLERKIPELKGHCRCGIAIRNSMGTPLFVCSTETSKGSPFKLDCTTDQLICQIPNLPLSRGRYTLVLYIEVNNVVEDYIDDAFVLEVEDADYFGTGKNCPSGWEGRSVLIPHEWELVSTS